jgi:hypothetical protein
VNNNPLRYTDPTGHMLDDGCNSGQCGGSTVNVIETLMKAGMDPKKKQYRQQAIKMTINHYHIGTAHYINGTPSYDPLLDETWGNGTAGNTNPDRTVQIGPSAFSSPGMLAATIAHEGMHSLQIKEGRDYSKDDLLGSAMNETEAYDYEIATADKYGLTASEVKEVESRRDFRYKNYISGGDYQQRVDTGIYTESGNSISNWINWITHPGEL